MSRPGQSSAVSQTALEAGAVATPPRLSAEAMGRSGSSEALAKLDAAVAELRAIAIQPLLQASINALNSGDAQAGAEWAIKTLEKDERNGLAWYLLAFAREAAGDFVSSIRCYETALTLLPDHAEVANDLGRLAFRMGMIEQAEKLFRHFIDRHPFNPEGANNLACAVRDMGRHDEAAAILKDALLANPEVPMMWNTLGTVVTEQGEVHTARVFFEEALRLDPAFAKARYNRGNTRLALGDVAGALEDCEAALALKPPEGERQMMQLARSTILIADGRLADGWDAYEARLDPQFADVTQFMVDRPRWAPGDDLAGKSLLVIGEQGLGDEVLFANTLPDVIEALGPDGRLSIAVEKRLVPLFQRSFPGARLGAHATFSAGGRSVRLTPSLEDHADIDLWTPIGSLLREFRRSPEAYPLRARYLIPDPARVAHWRAELEQALDGPRVGLLWKSLIKAGARSRYFSPFEQWEPVLRTPGVCFVNLQYGDCAEEIAQAERELGVSIWTPPRIDLKADLDDVAALTCALDLTIGFSNATLNLAGACGAPTWLISTPGAWPRLGADRYLWYPQTRLYAPSAFGEWAGVMQAVADDLDAFAAAEH
ncbi:MAG: tetratricopeptide repeat protein [Phenylobacterium sp.]|uniref:tetratricopeptide repeat protein n=1 Tax=Phenylobacterium sp. TaxID=1871053 RepID=UPI002733C98B|nr:tetratricopeptide repeat protein [Phenylobacterium sp.]MDP3176215.1 tetratricopeptide repeat protein [Phenylobacterium sp.]